jgi:hypothetical protein
MRALDALDRERGRRFSVEKTERSTVEGELTFARTAALTSEGRLVSTRGAKGVPISWTLRPRDGEDARPAPGMESGDRFVATVDLRRVMVHRPTDPDAKAAQSAWNPVPGTLELVDLTTGATSPVVDDADRAVTCDRVSIVPCHATGSQRLPNGDQILLVEMGGMRRLARYRAAESRLSAAAGESVAARESSRRPAEGRLEPVALDGDELTVVSEGRRIVRVRFGSDVRIVLFPRE